MKHAQLGKMTDAELVENFRKWAIEQGRSFADVDKNNKIDTDELMPCFDVLAARGMSAVHKLVALTEDPDPKVQLNAAAFAFEADPNVCRQALLKLMKRQDAHALFAWMILARHDPKSAPSPNELFKNSYNTQPD